MLMTTIVAQLPGYVHLGTRSLTCMTERREPRRSCVSASVGAPLSHSVRRACRRPLGERLCDVPSRKAAEPGAPDSPPGVFRLRGTGLSEGSCALPVAANSPHSSTNWPPRVCSILASDLWSPLTESNRRPSPYHRQTARPCNGRRSVELRGHGLRRADTSYGGRSLAGFCPPDLPPKMVFQVRSAGLGMPTAHPTRIGTSG